MIQMLKVSDGLKYVWLMERNYIKVEHHAVEGEA